MVSPTQSDRVTYETLFDVTITGGVLANIRAKMGEDNARKLLTGQAAEITEIEIISPLIGASGIGEALEQITPVIDGKLYLGGDQVIIRGDLDAMYAPPKPTEEGEVTTGPNQGKRSVFKLGTGLPDLAGIIDREPWRISENTTIKTKLKGTIDFEFLVGNTAITGDFRVIARGWKYETTDVIERYMRLVYGVPRTVPFTDPMTGRDFTYTVPAKSIKAENFTELIGGEDQPTDQVTVKRILRWARNKIATTPNTKFPLSFDDGNVNARSNDMDFDIDNENLLVLNKIGVRPATNHLETSVEVNSLQMLKIETVAAAYNDLLFGRAPTSAVGAAITVFLHKFKELPMIQPITISNETGKVILLDNGTAIAAGENFGAGSMVVLDGIQVFDPSFATRGANTAPPTATQ